MFSVCSAKLYEIFVKNKFFVLMFVKVEQKIPSKRLQLQSSV